jgi:hypothetical protein
MGLRGSVFARPPRFRGMFGGVSPLLFGKPCGSGFTAFQTASPPQFDGGRIFVNPDPILNLPVAISTISFPSWIGSRGRLRRLKRALEAGINFFDTANRYSLGNSEEILGRAIRDFARREEIVIATKVYGRMRPGPNGAGLSRKAIMGEIDASLRRLGTDYVDLQ